MIYEAEIESDDEIKTYIGLSANLDKKRIVTSRTTINCKPEDKIYA